MSSGSDPFAHLDGAYVLDALDDDERRAFEAHMDGCAACRARVDEIAGVPALLAGVTLEDVLAADVPTDAGPVPDTLLPALVREARVERRRRWVLLSTAGAVAAACVAALIAVLVTMSSPATTHSAAAQPMQQVIPTPVHARVSLVDHRGGTRIRLACHYDAGNGPRLEYAMTVVDRSGHRHGLTSWYIRPGQDDTFTADTHLSRAEIRAVEVTLPGGQPILRLRT